MTRPSPPRKGRKLLVASLGVGTLTFACCGVFPGCNLMAPPPCGTSGSYTCPDLGVPDQGRAPDLSVPRDMSRFED